MQPTYQNVSLIVEAAYDKSKKSMFICLLVHGPTPQPQPPERLWGYQNLNRMVYFLSPTPASKFLSATKMKKKKMEKGNR